MNTPSDWVDHGTVTTAIPLPPTEVDCERAEAHWPARSNHLQPLAEYSRTTRVAGRRVTLSPDERRLLAVLARRRGQILTIDRLARLFADRADEAAADRSSPAVFPPIERCARAADSLRRKLPCAAESWHLRAVRGRGYVLWPV